MNAQWKLFLGFTCCGGALGGLIYAFIIAGIGNILNFREYWDLITMGMMFGTLPAMLCGLWLIYVQARRNVRGFVHAALSGAVLSFFCEVGSCWVMVQGYCLHISMMVMYLMLAGIGMGCALLLAWWLLPLSDNEKTCNE